MLRGLSDYLIALLELLEAEGRSAKRNAYALATAAAIFSLGTLLLAGAAGFLISALWLALILVMDPALVALICGVLLLGMGVIVLWMAREKLRQLSRKPTEAEEGI